MLQMRHCYNQFKYFFYVIEFELQHIRRRVIITQTILSLLENGLVFCGKHKHYIVLDSALCLWVGDQPGLQRKLHSKQWGSDSKTLANTQRKCVRTCWLCFPVPLGQGKSWGRSFPSLPQHHCWGQEQPWWAVLQWLFRMPQGLSLESFRYIFKRVGLDHRNDGYFSKCCDFFKAYLSRLSRRWHHASRSLRTWSPPICSQGSEMTEMTSSAHFLPLFQPSMSVNGLEPHTLRAGLPSSI